MKTLLEKDLVHKIVKGANTFEYHKRIKIQPIESGGTGLGIPDMFIRTERNDLWAEAKRIILKSKIISKISIPYQPGQYSWLKSYYKLGGHAFLFCLVIDTFGLNNIYKSIHSNKVHIFKDKNIKETYSYKEFTTLPSLILNYKMFDFDRFYKTLNRE